MIPINWFNQDKTKAYWPPYKNQIYINKAIAKMENPNEQTWIQCDVNKILGQAESYKAAVEKVKLAQNISDIDAVSEEQYKKSRHDRAKVNKDTESSDDSAKKKKEKSKTLPIFPKVPNLTSSPKPSTCKPAITSVSIIHEPRQPDYYESFVEKEYLFAAKNIKQEKIKNKATTSITRTPSTLVAQSKMNVLSNITNVEHIHKNILSDNLEEDTGLDNSSISTINNTQVSTLSLLDCNKEMDSLYKMEKKMEAKKEETSEITSEIID